MKPFKIILVTLTMIQSIGYAQQDIFFLENAPILTLQELLKRGLEENLDIQIEETQIAVEEMDVEIFSSAFDPTLEGSLLTSERKNPSSSSLTSGGQNITRGREGELGLLKRFPTGLESRITLNSSRSTNNSRVDGLRPQYRSQLVLNLIQPLLRDFGAAVNTSNIQLSQNEVVQALYAYQDQALQVAEAIELAYFDLAESVALYQFRRDSLNLAQQLLEANQMKFDAGLAPISELQEAETAAASRRELVIAALQQVEIVMNRLRDLLEISSEDPLYHQSFITPPIQDIEPFEPNLVESLIVAFAERPDLRRLRKEVDGWNIQLKYYRNQKLPRVDLQATLGLNGLSGKSRAVPDLGDEFRPTTPHVGDYFESFGHLVEGEGLEWFVGVQVSYPLGNRAAEARYQQTDLQKYQAIMRMKQLENTIETDIKNAMTLIQRSRERVQVAQQFQDLADRSLLQENERFRQGVSDTFRILDFQDDVIDARIRKTGAIIDYHQGLANYYRALGTNLERFGIQLQTHSEAIIEEGLLHAP